MSIYWGHENVQKIKLFQNLKPSMGKYPMFIEPMITRVPSGFSEYIWLDTKIVF